MVIRGSDTVAAALRRDESLIAVFAGLSPVFKRLCDPDMGKVMSRLVTVEQAARMAGLDGGELVRRLNDVLGGEGPTTSEEEEMTGRRTTDRAVASGMAAAPEDLAPEKVVEVDVREDLRAGREPFSRIMAALQDVPRGGCWR